MKKELARKNLSGWFLILIALGIVGYFLEGPVHYIARDVFEYHLSFDSDGFLMIVVFIGFSVWLESLRDKLPLIVRVLSTIVALMAATYLGERYAWPH
jgi:DMSO reductase anchor subunit